MKRKTMIGAYGAWAADLVPDRPGDLSFRHRRFASVGSWRAQARAAVLERMAPPPLPRKPAARVHRQYEFDGLHIEELSWQLPYGPPTQALFLKPAGATGRLPGILGLHCHGGRKFLGRLKIVQTSGRRPPVVRDHQQQYYGGVGWANEAAKRGYAVLVHDAFTFASRRVRCADVSPRVLGSQSARDPTTRREIDAYNAWAGQHEHIMAKSLFAAGTTWPGVFFGEDRYALDVLAARPDVDAARLGCGGLSGGGLRTVMLAGLDARIQAAFCAGFMTTWRDLVLDKCFTHTWMAYIPLLPRHLDFPEILGLRVPRPCLVLNAREDSLYTLPEMKRADRILREVYAKAGAPERYDCRFYPGGHKFDRAMQADAFAWLDGYLRPAYDSGPARR